MGAPVTGSELADLARSAGATIEPGDALVVHCGREAWEAANGRPWGSGAAHGANERPGLDASCLEFFADIDCSVIIWDMMDVRPNRFGVAYSTHAALFNQGIALVDNAALGPLTALCREYARHDFLTVIAPLRLRGATGCPVNPLAIL